MYEATDRSTINFRLVVMSGLKPGDNEAEMAPFSIRDRREPIHSFYHITLVDR